MVSESETGNFLDPHYQSKDVMLNVSFCSVNLSTGALLLFLSLRTSGKNIYK